MFNLIISIIAIALVVALAGASLYYGGHAFKDNKVEAEAARYRNEAQQIAAAVTLYKAKGNEITDSFALEDLVTDNYLKDLPAGWTPGSDKIMRTLDESDTASEHICMAALDQAGFDFDPADADVDAYSGDANKGVPHCDKANLDPLVPCCVNKTP